MKLKEIVIKNFGKFTDKTVDFGDGINVLYGENESGKSTIHTFIRSMLFGLERGRGRASLNDTFRQYEPWENPNYYAGTLKFESGGKTFVIRRNFDKYSKSAQLYCETDGEELSIPDGDLTQILNGMTEDVYANTVSIGQMQVEPGQQLSDALKNYAANYYACGDGDLNLSAAMQKLAERRKGIEKDRNAALKEKQAGQDRIEQESSYVWRDIHSLQEEIEGLDEKISEREEEESQKEQEPSREAGEGRRHRWRINPLLIALFAVLIAAVFVLVPRPWSYPVAIVVFLLCGIYIWNRMKIGKKPEKTEPEKILEEITPEGSLEKLRWERDRARAELKEKEVQYNNLQEQIEELDEPDENLKKWEEERQAVSMAEERLKELSRQMQDKMKQVMSGRVSEIMKELTGGKYTRLRVEDDFSVSLWQEDRKIPADRLSRGTIEQIYFALRMASVEMMQEEEYPVILDDTFAYYDDERLDHTLEWLYDNKKQVLLFTCQRREKEALDRMRIPYTFSQI